MGRGQECGLPTVSAGLFVPLLLGPFHYDRRGAMNFVGIDIGTEAHTAVAVNDHGLTVRKPFRLITNRAVHAVLCAELDHGPIQLVMLESHWTLLT